MTGMEPPDTVGAVFGGLPRLVGVGHHYANAPIIEATIDLRIAPESADLSRLSEIYLSEEGFFAAEPMYAFSSTLTVDEGESIVGRAAGTQVGLTYRKVDGSCVIRAATDRYAYSLLAPYGSWEAFLQPAESYWFKYRDVVQPAALVAIGVRFVNKINVPGDRTVEVKDYLRTSIELSPYLPQSINGYFAQASMPLDAFDAGCVITTALIEPEPDAAATLILDIDVRRQTDLAVASEDFDTQLVAALGTLRVAKNYVFEACITDATRGLIS